MSKNFKNQEQRKSFFKILREFLAVILFLGLVIFLLVHTLHMDGKRQFHIRCNAETTDQWEGLKTFFQEGNHFSGGNYQTDEFAFEGQHSMWLVKDSFGFEYHLKNIRGNELINVEVWRFAEGDWLESGKLVASIDGLTYQVCENVVDERDGWEKIHLEFSVPLKSRNTTVKFYCWNPHPNKIYFDNLDIWVQRKEDLFAY